MTGLEKIIEHIRQDAQIASKTILTQGEEDVKNLLETAENSLQDEKLRQDEKKKRDIEQIESRGQSAAKLMQRKMLLEAKQKMIGETIEAAKASLSQMPENEYFDIIYGLAQKNVLAKAGEIVFSKNDLARVPAGFEEKLNKLSLSISKETKEINGGFLLLYGDIEENCSFDAIFLAAKESLQDEVRDYLFG